MKRFLSFLMLLSLLFFFWQGLGTSKIIFVQTANGQIPIEVQVAERSDDQIQGLMGVSHLPDGKGMLFVYESPKELAFWMKNMLIPIDMIFVSEGLEIVHIEAGVPICNADPCPRYSAPTPVQYILEVPAGFAERQGMAVGDLLMGLQAL